MSRYGIEAFLNSLPPAPSVTPEEDRHFSDILGGVRHAATVLNGVADACDAEPGLSEPALLAALTIEAQRARKILDYWLGEK